MDQHILLVSSGIFHPPLPGRMTFHKTLRRMEGFTLTQVASLERLPHHTPLPDVIALYFHHKHLSPAALAALDRFVSGGGGLLAVHSATASFKTCGHYFEILGGRFTGHGAVAPLQVQPAEAAGQMGALFQGIEPFIIRDELYLHELQPGIQTHFYADYQGKKVPVVWTYRYGRGRVCYLVAGHTSASMAHPSIQKILRRAAGWVSGRIA
jgi:type 1 glutamine amidotransferase